MRMSGLPINIVKIIHDRMCKDDWDLIRQKDKRFYSGGGLGKYFKSEHSLELSIHPVDDFIDSECVANILIDKIQDILNEPK